MKTNKTLVISLVSAALATCGFAQGKSGGNPPNAGAASRAPSAPPAATRHAPPADTPATSEPRGQKPATPATSADRADRAERSAAPAAQDYTARLHEINQTAFSDRRQLLDNADMSLKSNRDALKQIQTTAKESRADARGDFKAALNDVKARENELEAALKESRKADEAGWNARRDALAKAYQNHADAMARLQTAARPQ
jgi:hypothetical protein